MCCMGNPETGHELARFFCREPEVTFLHAVLPVKLVPEWRRHLQKDHNENRNGSCI